MLRAVVTQNSKSAVTVIHALCAATDTAASAAAASARPAPPRAPHTGRPRLPHPEPRPRPPAPATPQRPGAHSLRAEQWAVHLARANCTAPCPAPTRQGAGRRRACGRADGRAAGAGGRTSEWAGTGAVGLAGGRAARVDAAPAPRPRPGQCTAPRTTQLRSGPGPPRRARGSPGFNYDLPLRGLSRGNILPSSHSRGKRSGMFSLLKKAKKSSGRGIAVHHRENVAFFVAFCVSELPNLKLHLRRPGSSPAGKFAAKFCHWPEESWQKGKLYCFILFSCQSLLLSWT